MQDGRSIRVHRRAFSGGPPLRRGVADPVPGSETASGFFIPYSRLSGEELLDQGIRPNTIRLSIGTEHIDDLLADLDKGFQAVQNL